MATEVSNTVYSLFPLDSIEEGTPEVAQVAWAMLQVCSHGLCLAVLARVPPAVHCVAASPRTPRTQLSHSIPLD